MKKHRNTTLVEGKFGHGAVRNSLDLRDRKWKKIAKAGQPFDWNVGHDIEHELQIKLNDPFFKIPVKNQGTTFSCCGQAGSYYESVQDAFEKGVFTEKSARDVYSQIFYPGEGGGSTTRDVLSLIPKKGVCKESLMSSYEDGETPSESFMRSRKDESDITKLDALSSRGSGYSTVDIDIDSFAQAIRDCRGMVFTISGENNGTWLSKFPKPPTKRMWGHELYAGKAKLINGKKFIGFINSWGRECGDNGWQWIGEDYFNTKFIYSAGVLYDSPEEYKKSLLEKLLSLLQKFISILSSTKT